MQEMFVSVSGVCGDALLRLQLLPTHRLARLQPLCDALFLADAVDDLQIGLGAGFDDVGADASATDRRAVVLRFDDRFAHCVLADSDAANVIILQLHIDAGDALDC
jgi:hypothetical protein